MGDQVGKEEEPCSVCFCDIAELGGATILPCKCRVPYCHGCWDRCLASSMSSTGNAKCPTCRSVVRVDYDAGVGRLVFSKAAEEKVEFSESWEAALDALLERYGVVHDDDASKFAVSDNSGTSKRLWSRHTFALSWEPVQARGGLQRVLDMQIEAINKHPILEKRPELAIPNEEIEAGPSIMDCNGNEVDMESLSKEHFPVVVKYPKRADKLIHRPDTGDFPLALTFKEYMITVDNTVGLPSLRQTFSISSSGALVVGDTNLSLVSQWKDHGAGVQLHAGDWIIEVNGARGAAEELVQQLEKKEVLKIRVQQSGRIATGDSVYDTRNTTRERLTKQTKPRQLALLKEYGARSETSGESPGLFCVCGGALERLGLHARVCKLVEPKDESGVLRHNGQNYTVDTLIHMGAITCNLCDSKVGVHDEVWTCENGQNTVLHAHSYDICINCLKTATGERERDRELIRQQEQEYAESLRLDKERAEAALRADQAEALHREEAHRNRAAQEEQEREHAAELQQRRDKFESLYPSTGNGEPQVSVRFRSTDGCTLQRSFATTVSVSVLFEFAAIAEWANPPPAEFDLQTTYPKLSLWDRQGQALQEIGLDSSVLLCIVAR